MNFLLISPHFPENFKPFAYELKKKGANVLGIGDAPYQELGAELQEALTEYYLVEDLENTADVKRAVAHLFFKHGPIDRIESHNEYWLELDAELREQFNVPGVRPAELRKTKFKSEMKKVFKKAGVPVVDGRVVAVKSEIKDAVQQLGLPVIAKPDNGVGSAATYKLQSEEDVERFAENFDDRVPYFIEQMIQSDRLGTYDGLIDSDGNIVFETSLIYSQPTLEFIDGQADMAYVILEDVDPKLAEYGQAIVKEFGMKERFFHIEFFKLPDGDFVALEYNNRLAGNFAVDMYNFTHSISLFEEYAGIVMGEAFKGNSDMDKQFCVGITQRDIHEYVHSPKEITEKYGDKIRLNQRMPEVFTELMGDQFFAILADTQADVDEVIAYIHERKS